MCNRMQNPKMKITVECRENPATESAADSSHGRDLSARRCAVYSLNNILLLLLRSNMHMLLHLICQVWCSLFETGANLNQN
jgi:hypothetical protein